VRAALGSVIAAGVVSAIASTEALAGACVCDEVESRISIRHWDEKGAGTVTGSALLTVIRSASGGGDVAILVWDRATRTFTAEVYRPLPRVDDLREWQLAGASDARLSEQPGQRYVIHRTQPGKDGGLVSQTFVLPEGTCPVGS